jgi:hypothetical protein
MSYNLDYFVDKLSKKEPFAINRFNDGEMGVILNTHGVVSRGDQKSSTYLKLKLLEAVTYRHYNYFVGMPDRKFKSAYDNAKMIVGDYKNITSSVIFHDDNWTDALRGIVKNADKFDNIVWVGSRKHDTGRLPFRIDRHITTRHKDSFKEYGKIRSHQIEPGSLVFVSCGPLGRILTKEWFEWDRSLTILEVGSVFDPMTQNVWRPYQKRQRGEMTRLLEYWKQNR